MSFRIYAAFIVFLAIGIKSMQGQSWADTLIGITEDTVKLNLVIDEFNKKVYADPTRTKELATLFDSLATSVNSEYYNAEGHNLSGMAHYVNGEYSEAIIYFIDAISYFEKIDDKERSATVYNNLSTCYQVTGDNEKSIEYSLKALDIFEQLNDSTWIASVNSNLGLLYLNDNNLDEASKYLDVAIPLLKQLGKDIQLGVTYLSRGNLRIQQERYGESIIDYKESMKLVPQEIVPLLHAAAKGGNYLLNIGPMGDGPIPQPSLDRLEEIGEWVKTNGEAIFAVESLGADYKEGEHIRFTKKKNSPYYYAISLVEPSSEVVLKKIIPKKGSQITMLGASDFLDWSYTSARGLVIEVPQKSIDEVGESVGWVFKIEGENLEM